MNSECQLVLELWEQVRDHLPAPKRGEVASAMVRAVAEYGFEARDLRDLTDEDPHLARAFLDVFDEEPEDDTQHGDGE